MYGFQKEDGVYETTILIQAPCRTQRPLIAVPFQKKRAIPRTDPSITSPATIKIKIILLGFYQDVRDESNRNVFLLNWNPEGLQTPEKEPHTFEIESKTKNR